LERACVVLNEKQADRQKKKSVTKQFHFLETVQLGFMGGQSGDSVLKVYGMQMPEVGERGIYFVENLSVQQIHPLCGWQQGHCLVISQKQTDQDMVIPVEDKGSLNTNSFALTHAPTLEVFKQNIRNMIEK